MKQEAFTETEGLPFSDPAELQIKPSNSPPGPFARATNGSSIKLLYRTHLLLPGMVWFVRVW